MIRLAMFALCVLVLGLVGAGCARDGGGKPAEPSLIEQYINARKITDPEVRADTLIAVGLKQLNARDSSSAELSLKEAGRAIDEIRNAPDAQSRLYLALATGYQRSGNKSQAVEALDGAAKAIATIDTTVAKSSQLAELATLRAGIGDADAALAEVRQAEKLLEKLESPLDKIDVLSAVMRTYATLKNQAELDRVVAAANKLAEAQERPSDNARVLLRLATAQASLGQADAAKATLDKAVGLARGISGKPLLQAHVLFSAAEGANAIGQRALCQQLLTESEQAAKKSPEGGEVLRLIESLRRKLGF